MKKKYYKNHSFVFKQYLWKAILESNTEDMIENILKVIKLGGYRKRLEFNKLKPIKPKE